MRASSRHIWLAGGLLTGLSGTASGEELCVTCADPAAVYRCAIEGDAASAPAAPGLQLHCIKELASRAGHKSCSISRTRAGAICEGALVTLARPATGLAPVPAVDAQAQPVQATPLPATAGAAPAGAVPPSPAPGEPPATVEALAKQAAEASKKDWDKTAEKLKETTAATGQELEKAGDAVGGAVKKSWNCLTSLFSRC